METGGQLDSVAIRWESDFSVTGSKHSSVVTFPYTKTVPVTIEIVNDSYTIDNEENVVLPANFRINVATYRMVCAINGPPATSLSGEAYCYLYNALSSGMHYQLGMSYKSYKAHTATLAISNVRVVSTDSNGRLTKRRCCFKEASSEDKDISDVAATVSKKYVENGWNMRQQVVYAPSPMLHKTVFVDNASVLGYSMLHSILDRKAYVTLDTLNTLFETAIACDCCQDKADIQNFKSSADRPGLAAAKEATTIANATSLIVNVLMSYRADGANVMLPAGAGFICAENWNSAVPRSCLEANDCDGVATLAVTILRTAVDAGPDDLQQYEYLKYVRNVIHPYYQPALSVIGATASEGTSADGSNLCVAGHAVAVLVPTMSLLRALARTAGKGIGEAGAKDTQTMDKHNLVASHRFGALFDGDATKNLPTSEQILLADWPTAMHEFKQVPFLAIEGTTPTSSTLYVENPVRRFETYKEAQKDKQVFGRASPNVFRSVKRLYAGFGISHTFYSSFVEITFAPDFPLYTYPQLRSLDSAATQYLLYSDIEADNISAAGASPAQLVLEKYGALPLLSMGVAAANALDAVAATTKQNVIPPRVPGPVKLNSFQSESLAASMKHIEDLEALLAAKPVSTEGNHCVAYICAFNTLVHSPGAVKQFVETIDKVASSGIVDKTIVPGLAWDDKGNDVGLFLHIDIYAPV